MSTKRHPRSKIVEKYDPTCGEMLYILTKVLLQEASLLLEQEREEAVSLVIK